MPSERAMKAADEILGQMGCDHVPDDSLSACTKCTADLIDRAAEIPALEARVAELEARQERLFEQNLRLVNERDALAKRLEAVVAYCEHYAAGTREPERFKQAVRLARGES